MKIQTNILEYFLHYSNKEELKKKKTIQCYLNNTEKENNVFF